MKMILTPLMLFISMISFGQTLPTKKEQYDFLRWYVNYKELTNTVLSDTASTIAQGKVEIAGFINTIRQSKAISTANVNYLKKQLNLALKPQLEKTEFPNVKWRVNFEPDSLFHHFSLPIFSIDKRVAFIQHGYHCGGTCGKDGIVVYQRSNKGNWKVSKLPIYFPYMIY